MSAGLRDSRPRVLHLLDCPRTGGAETMAATLVGELSRSERVESLVCVANQDGANPSIVRALRSHAAEFRNLDAKRQSDPRLLLGLVDVIRRYRVDVVHSHPGGVNVNSRLASLILRTAQMTTIHTPPGTPPDDYRRRDAFLDGWSARLSTCLVAPSKAVAVPYARAFRLPMSRFCIVPNPAPSAVEAPDSDSRRLRMELSAGRSDLRLVVCVARLQRGKGIGDLIDAVALVRDRVPGLLVVVAGTGPEEDRLRRRVQQRQLEDTVRLLGHRSDVGNLLEAADAFCLPSHHEGLPVSVLEAMAAGVPCIATAVGATPELIQDGVTGLLVPPRSVARLADAITRLLGDRVLAERLGAQGRRLAEDEYSPRTVAAKYADLYDRLTRLGRAARSSNDLYSATSRSAVVSSE